MNRAFADSLYWIARINPRDQWHRTFQSVIGLRLLTTDEVLDEVLAHFSAFGPAMRSRTVASYAISSSTQMSRLSLSPERHFSTAWISTKRRRRQGLQPDRLHQHGDDEAARQHPGFDA